MMRNKEKSVWLSLVNSYSCGGVGENCVSCRLPPFQPESHSSPPLVQLYSTRI